jgi:hypothetical protein
MLMAATHTSFGVRAGAVLALCALLAGVLATTSVDRADARPAKTLGKTKRTPNPSCPRTPCEAVGSVTGFQVTGDRQRGLFKARESGQLVAWAISLSKPNSEQREFFSDFYSSPDFGSRPTARIAVLKRGDGRRYTLKRQSPVVELSSALGSRQVFTLSDPLRISRGEVLALTIPTWAPAFAVGLKGKANVWRASRGKRKCEGTRNIKNGDPIQKTGSDRVFGCDYRTARLLYWGYYVPS